MTDPRQSRPIESTPRERILSTARHQVVEHGMTVSLEHLSLEKIIRASGVSRATAYRIWPNKQQFLADVLVDAVRSTDLEVDSRAEVAQLVALLDASPGFASDEHTRRNVIVEGLRISIQADFERVAASAQWATYLALNATNRGLPDGPLRDEVTQALADMQQVFIEQRCIVYARLPRLLGYHLVPPLDGDQGFRLMSEASGALMTGFVAELGARPQLLADTFQIAAYGADKRDWTVPAFALTGLLLSYIEPDPDVIWDDAQLARAHATLEEITTELEHSWTAGR